MLVEQFRQVRRINGHAKLSRRAFCEPSVQLHQRANVDHGHADLVLHNLL